MGKSIFFLLFLSISIHLRAQTADFSVCVCPDEQKLYESIMAYRKEHKLPRIPLSASLSYVAQQHVKDLFENKPDLQPGCNAHSWSDQGPWTTCPYTPDHANAACMWSKPAELTAYPGSGFEIAVGSSNPIYDAFVMTPEYALRSWQNSSGHNAVILNQTVWKTSNWKAIGVAIYKGFSVVWFGTEEDSAGVPVDCE